MLHDLLLVAGQVFTLFLMMAVGFVLARRGWLNAEGLSQMSRLLLYIVTPCIIIHSLQSVACTPELTGSVLRCLGALAASYLLYMALALPFFPKSAPDERDTLRMGIVYGNTGFMGIPLIMGILGQEAMLYCTVSLGVFNIATWTHGAILMGGRENASLKKAVLNPGVVACAVGFLLFFTGVKLPGPADAAMGYLADLNTPLAMVVIGGQMAGADFGATFRRGKLYLVSGMKLLAIPLLTAAFLLPFGLNSLTYQTLVILSACPAAGITGIFAQQFQRDTAAAAQLITLSTLLSIFTLPVMAVAAAVLA